MIGPKGVLLSGLSYAVRGQKTFILLEIDYFKITNDEKIDFIQLSGLWAEQH